MQSDETNQSDSARPGPAAVSLDIARDNAVPEDLRAGLSDKDSTDADSTHAADDASVPGGDARTAPPGTPIRDAAQLPLVPDQPLPNSDIAGSKEGNIGWEIGQMIAWASLACLLTLANRFIGATLPLPPPDTFLRHLASLLYLAPLLLSLIQTARTAVALPLSATFLFVTGAVLSLPALAVVFITLTHVEVPGLTFFYSVLPPALQTFVNNFLGPVGLCFVGAAIGRVIRHPNTLLAAAGFAFFFDIVVVTMGTVAQLLKSRSNLISAVSVGAGGNPVSLPGMPAPKLPDPVSFVTIGPADVLFIALFLSAVYFLKRTWKTENAALRGDGPDLPSLAWEDTGRWMFGLLLLALVVVEFFGLPIPALAPMGVAVLIANARLAAFTPTEKRDLAIGAVFAVFCATLMVLWARRAVPPEPPQLGVQLAMDPRTHWLVIARIQRDSPAARAGLRPGDAITAINGQPVQTINDADLTGALEAGPKKGITLQIRRWRQRNPQTVTVSPEMYTTSPPASPSPAASPVPSASPQATGKPQAGEQALIRSIAAPQQETKGIVYPPVRVDVTAVFSATGGGSATGWVSSADLCTVSCAARSAAQRSA